jgi:hypothetical protein
MTAGSQSHPSKPITWPKVRCQELGRMITIHRTRITRDGVTRLKILQTTTVAGEIQLRLQHQMTIILEVRKIQIQQPLRPPTITIQQAGEATKT